MISPPTSDFGNAAREGMHDDSQARTQARLALDGLKSRRAVQFSDPHEWAALRALGGLIREHTLRHLPELLETLETNLTANGIQVHWAETVEQGNAIVARLVGEEQVKQMVKAQSAVCTEMGLHHAIESLGVTVTESDVVGGLLQQGREWPSHMVIPALHKTGDQVAPLSGATVTDVEGLCRMARRTLRDKFAAADAGLSGVNFAVAETGTLVLVENEGNARMCASVPRMHIAVMGLEKVTARLEDVPPLLSLLTRSASGQAITAYVSMLSGPRRSDEKDGPDAVHLIILDNGRTRLYADPQWRKTLQCIRCGACQNHCPIYDKVGGHAYPGAYSGLIGTILAPQQLGNDDAGTLAQASRLCHPCTEVCPVLIPLDKLLIRRRIAQVQAAGDDLWLWRLWALIHRFPLLYRLHLVVLRSLGRVLPQMKPPSVNWPAALHPRRMTAQNLHQLARAQRISDA